MAPLQVDPPSYLNFHHPAGRCRTVAYASIKSLWTPATIRRVHDDGCAHSLWRSTGSGRAAVAAAGDRAAVVYISRIGSGKLLVWDLSRCWGVWHRCS